MASSYVCTSDALAAPILTPIGETLRLYDARFSSAAKSNCGAGFDTVLFFHLDMRLEIKWRRKYIKIYLCILIILN